MRLRALELQPKATVSRAPAHIVLALVLVLALALVLALVLALPSSLALGGVPGHLRVVSSSVI